MALDQSQVEHVAGLARLSLTAEEIAQYTEQLSDILGYIEQLDQVDTTDVPPTSQVTEALNQTRPDEVTNGDEPTRQRILDAVPQRQDDFIAVKAVFDTQDD